MTNQQEAEVPFKIRKREVDLALKEIEKREALAKAELAEHEAALKRLERQDEERVARYNGARDDQFNVYWFDTPVNAQSAGACIGTLRTWHRLNPTAPFTVVFKSPGGNVIDGMALFDEIVTLSQRGGGSHHITTVARGYAASMGGILLQAGDKRLIGKESYLLVHEVAAGTMGKIGDIKDDLKLYERMCDRVVSIFVERSEGKISKSAFVKNWTRTDWWLDSADTIKYGFADEIG